MPDPLFPIPSAAPRPARRGLLTAAMATLLTACATTPLPPATPLPVTPAAEPTKPSRLPKIGLALGGGAARGFAHIGVIKVLEAQGIHPDIVVGTSAGSVVGALYAAGNDGFALQKMALEMDEAAISDWTVPMFAKASGVLKGEAIQHYVNRAVGSRPIEKFRLPFGALATDLQSGAPILFRRGNAGLAVRASSAVPGVFQPVPIGGRHYVDGGLVAPVPVRFAREMGADIVIAVDISARPETQLPAGTLDVLLQTFSIMGQTINRQALQDADVVIRPNLPRMKGNDFDARNAAILEGELAATAAIGPLRERIARFAAQ